MIDLEKLKLSETMRDGLVRMAYEQRRRMQFEGGNVIALYPEPNNNTGKSLLNRGLLAEAGKVFGSHQLYTVTDLGLQVADAIKGDHNED